MNNYLGHTSLLLITVIRDALSNSLWDCQFWHPSLGGSNAFTEEESEQNLERKPEMLPSRTKQNFAAFDVWNFWKTC